MDKTTGEYDFTRLETVVFGVGKVEALGRELSRRGAKRALIVTGKTLGHSKLLDQVKSAAGNALAGIFSGAAQHVPSKTVTELVAEARRVGADAMVSFGGGSPIDTVKNAAWQLMGGPFGPALRPILDYIIQYYSSASLRGEMMNLSSGMLSGKVALVTGGSRGIGAGIVKRLAREGAAVAFTYAASREKAEQLARSVEAGGGTALAIHADSADAAAVQGAIDQTVKTLGRLDVFVNNAGILLAGTIDQVSLSDLDKMLAVNVRSVYVGIQAAARHMAEGGRIVTIGSIVAQRTAVPGASTYSMTKSAVAGMVRGVALDLAPRGITVNNVQPGPTATDMNPVDGPRSEMIRNLVPVKRFGTDDEIASLVAYLASPEAAFVTGASLTIDGGYLA